MLESALMRPVRLLIIALLAVGPLSLLQGIAWLSMALSTDLTEVTSGKELITALENELSTPCQLCQSVQTTQNEQPAATERTMRLEMAPPSTLTLLTSPAENATALIHRTPSVLSPQDNPGPIRPPPRS